MPRSVFGHMHVVWPCRAVRPRAGSRGWGWIMHRQVAPERAVLLAPVVLLLPLLALSACGSVSAPTDLPHRATPVAAYSFSPEQEPLGVEAYEVRAEGIEFVPWTDIEVTALGYYDDGGDGLKGEHTVGIFEKSSQDLVGDTVTVDAGSTLKDGFRYESITPVVLNGGTSYVLTGSNSPPFDVGAGDPDGLVWAPEVRYVDLAWAHRGSGFAFPRQFVVSVTWRFRSSANLLFRTPSGPAPAATP